MLLQKIIHMDKEKAAVKNKKAVSIEASANGKFSKETYLKWYESMLLMRKFEEKTGQLYIQQKIRGFCHLYIGQEALVAGSESVLRRDDRVITAYRDHAHPIGRGLECKYIICWAEQEWMQIKDYVAAKFGFDLKAPLLSKTILFGKCWEMLNLPDSSTKWIWDALLKKAKGNGREHPNTEDFINLLNGFIWPDFLQDKSYSSPDDILAKLVRKIH